MIRIILADDHPIVRQGISRLIEQQPNMRIVGEAQDGHQALRRLRECECDVFILDLSLPRMSGLEVLRRIRAEQPAVRVIVLSMYSADHYKERVLAQGAVAYVQKDAPPQELLQAINSVTDARLPSSETPARRPPQRAKPLHSKLSAREYQVFTLIFAGQSVTEIAAELDVNACTVSNHVAKIREKLGVHSIAEIVRYAHEAGIAGPSLRKR